MPSPQPDDITNTIASEFYRLIQPFQIDKDSEQSLGDYVIANENSIGTQLLPSYGGLLVLSLVFGEKISESSLQVINDNSQIIKIHHQAFQRKLMEITPEVLAHLSSHETLNKHAAFRHGVNEAIAKMIMLPPIMILSFIKRYTNDKTLADGLLNKMTGRISELYSAAIKNESFRAFVQSTKRDGAEDFKKTLFEFHPNSNKKSSPLLSKRDDDALQFQLEIRAQQLIDATSTSLYKTITSKITLPRFYKSEKKPVFDDLDSIEKKDNKLGTKLPPIGRK